MIGEAVWTALTTACEHAYPDEACGWVADRAPASRGVTGPVRAATGGARGRFSFSDDDLLAFIAATRGSMPPRLLFHSHPDGDATLSAVDRAALAPAGVVLHPLPHLVIAVAGARAHRATLYTWQAGAPVPIACFHRASHGWTCS